MPSRLSEVDLARLRRADARPAGPPPAGPSPGALAASRCVEVDRLVNGIGGITLANRLILVGSPLAGQRARIRLDGQLMHVITQDGVLWRTLPCPIPPRPAAPAPRRPPGRARPAARSGRHRAAAGLLPRRHPGRPPAHPGRHVPRGQDRHRPHREQHLPAGHRRRNRRRRAPHHQPAKSTVTRPTPPTPKAATHARREAGRRRRGRARRNAAVPHRLAGPRPRPPRRLAGRVRRPSRLRHRASCARTWTGSSSCSAAATASPCSAHDRGFPGPGRDACGTTALSPLLACANLALHMQERMS